MGRSRGFFRHFAILWAALHLALPAGFAIADARLAQRAEASPGVAHVEDHTGAQCPPVHAPDCALCQVLSTPGTAAAAAPLPRAVRVLASSVASAARRPGAGALQAAPSSRAPPGTIES
ncbi:MAG: hypothetical protein ACYC4J_06230 [Gemmatimonadaceae bacterium]